MASIHRFRFYLRAGVFGTGLSAAMLAAQPAAAQNAPTPNLVSVCTGVSLPRSVVTNIVGPVATGIATPLQDRVNILGATLPLLPPVGIDVAGLLANAAAGAPITLQALNTSGQVVAPTDRCDAQANSYTLTNPAGIAIGGNRITGLGSTGFEANAGEANSIAFGNSATTAGTSAGSIALGQGATVGANAPGGIAFGTGAQSNAPNGVALGAGSVAGRGALANYAAPFLTVPQNSAGEVSVGAPGALRQITNVAAGTQPTDAVNAAQLAAVAAQIGTPGTGAVIYDTATHDRVTLTGPAGTTLTNVAPGALTAASTDAVNGGQLYATNQNVAANTQAITNLTNTIGVGGAGPAAAVQYSNAATPTTPNGGTPTNDATLVGGAAGAVALHNVAAGAVQAGSTDAVNGGQLAGVSARVDTITNSAITYDNSTTRTRVTLGGAGGTTITNVAPGALNPTSTDAVNGSQLYATNQTIAANTNAITNNSQAITNLTTTVSRGGIGPVQYSNRATPTTPNGGTPTNDLTLVGAAAGPVGLHNIAGGTIAAGSTDAVNGGQVFALQQAGANAVTYTTDATGARTNTVALVGGNAAQPVAITNVAAGTVAAGSTGAVNGGQLFTTNQAVTAAQTTANAAQGTANSALALGQNSVQYDASRTSVTLNNGGSSVTVRNVAAGVSASDAVNVGQLNSSLNTALGQANGYTDARIAAVSFDLRNARRDSDAGTSSALAAAGLPQAYEAGKGMIALGGGVYGRASAFAIGASKAFSDGHTVVKVGGSYDTRGRAGASGGIGYQF